MMYVTVLNSLFVLLHFDRHLTSSLNVFLTLANKFYQIKFTRKINVLLYSISNRMFYKNIDKGG